MIKKNPLPLFILCVFCLPLLAPVEVAAEVQTLSSTTRQTFEAGQSADDARVVATARARQEVLKKAVPYIENLANVKSQSIPKAGLPGLTAGILETEIVSQKNYAVDKALVFEITAVVKVNTAILGAQAARLLKDKDLLKKYQALDRRQAGLLSRFSALEAENRKTGKPPSGKQETPPRQMKETINALAATDWYNKALDLANHQTFTGNISEEAVRYLRKAVDLDPAFGDALLWLGRVYYDQGEYDRAVEYYQQGIDITLKTGGENNPDLAAAYNRLGLACNRKGEYDRAIVAYRSAWKIQMATLGENHPDVATTYNNLGETYRHKGEYDRAIEYYRKDLEITSKALGRNHPGLATTYNNLGYAYHGKGQDDRALEYFQKALEICRTALGENHPQTKAVMKNIEFLKSTGPRS